MRGHATEELEREAADQIFLAIDIGMTQASRDHATDVIARVQNCDSHTHLPGGCCSHHSPSRGAVHHYVEFVDRRACSPARRRGQNHSSQQKRE